MKEFKNELNPIQYKYVYEVCRRLAPHLDGFDQYIAPETKLKIIFRALIDSLFEFDEFLDFLNRKSIINKKGQNVISVKNGLLDVGTIEKTDDEELIERAFIKFKSLFKLDRWKNDHFLDLPHSVLYELPYYIGYEKIEDVYKVLEEEFSKYITSLDISYKEGFLQPLEYECKSVFNDYILKKNDDIKKLYIDQDLMNAICATLNQEFKSVIFNRKQFIREFIHEIRCNLHVLDWQRREPYQKIKPEVTNTNVNKYDKYFEGNSIKNFYNYVYDPDISRMNLEDFIYNLFKKYGHDMNDALAELNIDPNELKSVIEPKRTKDLEKLSLIVNSDTIEEQLKKKLGEASNIKVPILNSNTSVHVYDYGAEELKRFARLINEISFYATNNITSEQALTDCINGVIPKLSILDRLNPLNASKKMESKIGDTKSNLTEIEKNLKTQILVYDYLMQVYEYRLKFIEEMENNVISLIDSGETTGLVKMGLEKKKDNIVVDKYNTLSMMEQIEILAHNHINILNMLYRTRETFITVIESQTLINSSVSQEKAALKNIRNIVDIYDSALSNDFVSAFSLIERLKSNGLDQTSALQLETNITNIQNLFSPSAVDENVINKPAKKPAKGPVSKRPVKRLTRTDNVLYKKENIDK